MTTLSQNDDHGPSDNVEVGIYDESLLSKQYDNWDSLSDEEKLSILEGEEPKAEFTEHNVTTNDYHEHLAELANPSTDTEPKTATHIGFGNSRTTPSPNDSSLNNENVRFQVTDRSRSGRDYQSITLLSSDQAVGLNLEEAGLFDSDSGGLMFNHVLLSDDPLLEPKTQEYAVTIRINLQFRDSTQV